MNAHETPSAIRQHWIEEAAIMFRDHFKANGYTVPDNVRFSIGFPVGAKDGKRKMGQCFPAEYTSDNNHEIFLSPHYDSTEELLNTIAHEMVHAVTGPGHKGPFKQCALAIGFKGPMTRTPNDIKMEWFINSLKAKLGEFPAGQLILTTRKKQTTRLLKCECQSCGYVARVAGKWIVEAGEPICPVDQEQMKCE